MQGVPAGGGTAQAGRRLDAPTVIRWLAGGVAILCASAGLLMLAVHVLDPHRAGPLVFSQIFEPYLLLALIGGSVLFALIARIQPATLIVLALLVAVVLRYASLLISFPAASPAGAQRLHLMTWNIEAGDVRVDEMVQAIEQFRPDVVGLIELVPRVSRGVEADERLRQQFPYQVLLPRSGQPDLGLLSRFPIVDHQFSQGPPNLLRAVVHPANEPPITVFVAHPFSAGIDQIGFVPDIMTANRDAQISQIRSHIDAELADGNDVLVLGDFNVTEREPAYTELSSGLHDAQREAGNGLGLTWRPEPLENLPFGLLRIDYLFASSDFVALDAGPDCTPRGSDHCLVTATFARPQTQPASASGTRPVPAATTVHELLAAAAPAGSR